MAGIPLKWLLLWVWASLLLDINARHLGLDLLVAASGIRSFRGFSGFRGFRGFGSFGGFRRLVFYGFGLFFWVQGLRLAGIRH